jgi:hypothetical protein
MLNWLIELIGGRTEEEYLLLTKEYDSQRDLVIQHRAREEYLMNELKNEKEDKKFLQNILFKRFGIIDPPEGNVQEQEQLQPVSSGTQRWSNLRARLERDDVLRMKETGAN